MRMYFSFNLLINKNIVLRCANRSISISSRSRPVELKPVSIPVGSGLGQSRRTLYRRGLCLSIYSTGEHFLDDFVLRITLL